MQTAKRQRGRPKGTGINDRDTLMRIAEIVAAHPSIKPTTAIKQAGITNPSTIRRLRDKFSEQGDQLIAEVRSRQTSTFSTAAAMSPAKPRINATVNPATKVSQRISSLASSLSGPMLQQSQPRGQTTNAARRPTGAQAPQPRPSLGLPANIETLVIGMIGEALGVKGPALTSSPIIALIKEQARMIDAILPILKQQLQSAERHMKKATVA
jgi:predicted component of type VI protein secretion system